jgi:ABC-2 type transport system permease protein
MIKNGVLCIARKEFFDHVKSNRFLLILGILFVIAIVGILNGISDYGASLTTYNNLQQTVSREGGTISPAVTWMNVKPSVLMVFFQMSSLFGVMGGILGIAMGFDLVTREKESRSLKILLAHPVYRDQVINGKALGGMAAILLAICCIMAVSLAILLIFGIVPEAAELFPILLYISATFLFIFSFFVLALFISTVCDDSGRSLVYTLIIFVAAGTFIPAIVTSPLVMDHVIGPVPELPRMIAGPADRSTDPATGAAETDRIREQNRETLDTYDRQTQEYGERLLKVADMQYLFSPTHNYDRITSFLTSPKAISNTLYPTMAWGPVGTPNDTSPDFGVSITFLKRADLDLSAVLAMISGNIIALMIQPGVFFGLAYVSFMRMDIR